MNGNWINQGSIFYKNLESSEYTPYVIYLAEKDSIYKLIIETIFETHSSIGLCKLISDVNIRNKHTKDIFIQTCNEVIVHHLNGQFEFALYYGDIKIPERLFEKELISSSEQLIKKLFP